MHVFYPINSMHIFYPMSDIVNKLFAMIQPGPYLYNFSMFKLYSQDKCILDLANNLIVHVKAHEIPFHFSIFFKGLRPAFCPIKGCKHNI